ncbi:MAG: hypothetical protein ABWY78_18535 [Microvirga sp.]
MNYRIVWHLVGQEGRFLDRGCLEDAYEDYSEAAVALNQWLAAYVEAGRSEDGSHWIARRSSDADLALRIWICQADSAPDEQGARVASLSR